MLLIFLTQPRSRVRAILDAGKLNYLLPASYHGSCDDDKNDFLAFHEFGADFVDTCKTLGFQVERVTDGRNPSLVTLVLSHA